MAATFTMSHVVTLQFGMGTTRITSMMDIATRLTVRAGTSTDQHLDQAAYESERHLRSLDPLTIG
jgi:hypothetical protein